MPSSDLAYLDGLRVRRKIPSGGLRGLAAGFGCSVLAECHPHIIQPVHCLKYGADDPPRVTPLLQRLGDREFWFSRIELKILGHIRTVVIDKESQRESATCCFVQFSIQS